MSDRKFTLIVDAEQLDHLLAGVRIVNPRCESVEPATQDYDTLVEQLQALEDMLIDVRNYPDPNTIHDLTS